MWPVDTGWRNRNAAPVTDLPRALALAFAQLADPRILTVLAKVVGITLAILAALYALLMTLLPSVLAQWWGTGDTYWLVITGLAGIIAAWFAFRLVALAVMQFFADEVVRAVEARHYPQAAAQARDVPWREELRHAVRGGVRALLGNAIAAPLALLLLFTAIGPAIVFGVVNAWLLGRELQDMAWLRHPHYGAGAQPVAPVTRFALGGVVAALLLVPFAGLVAPVIGAAAATHLVHRGAVRSKP